MYFKYLHTYSAIFTLKLKENLFIYMIKKIISNTKSHSLV